ncbi:MAG: cytochrome c [Rhizobiaceae bacterium]|nr:cytochrome c [Rhizobiaceae bacterium]
MIHITRRWLLITVTTSAMGSAQAADIAAGRALAQVNCARCHAIGPDGESPFAGAPAFRTLHERYPVRSLEEALSEGIIVGHSAMPQIAFEPMEIADLVAYLESLEPAQ